jgi:hypothetical protein
MSDEERIAKLQKLLDRVLTRGEPEEGAESSGPLNGEHTQVSGDAEPAPPPPDGTPALERVADPSDHKVVDVKDDEPPVPAALESRSRLVTAQPDGEAEELSPDDLVPASESSSELEAAAVPLVRRSKRPVTELERRDEAEPLSEGRIPLNVSDVHLADDAEKSLVEEIAAEEIHSGEIEEEAPISSRRPIDMESGARSDESPPESGKQVAAAPFDDPSSRRSGPPSGRVGPDVMRAEPSSSTKVASIVPPVPPRPATFGELLELALEL